MAPKHDRKEYDVGKINQLNSLIKQVDTNEDEIEIDLYDLFCHLMDNLQHIILCFFAGALIVNVLVYFFIHPTYVSTAKLYVVSASSDSVVNLSDLNIGSSLTSDYEQLILSYPVLEEVVEDMKLDMNYKELREMIRINNPTDTRVLEISVTSEDPVLSRDIANSVMKASVEYLPETMSTNEPNIAEKARIAEEKAGPSYAKFTVLGAVLGTFFACAWLVVLYILDDTIHTQDDMERIFGIVPLTCVPESELIEDNELRKDEKTHSGSFMKGLKKHLKKLARIK